MADSMKRLGCARNIIPVNRMAERLYGFSNIDYRNRPADG
jgi:hypothetical protein